MTEQTIDVLHVTTSSRAGDISVLLACNSISAGRAIGRLVMVLRFHNY